MSIVFISHALEEALEHSDRITVLRDGELIETDTAKKFNRERIVKAMIGRDLTDSAYASKKLQLKSHVKEERKHLKLKIYLWDRWLKTRLFQPTQVKLLVSLV